MVLPNCTCLSLTFGTPLKAFSFFARKSPETTSRMTEQVISNSLRRWPAFRRRKKENSSGEKRRYTYEFASFFSKFDVDKNRVEMGNMPDNPGCIFPESPTDVAPVLDYTGDGVRRSHEDSLKRLGVNAVYGLRVHDAEDEVRFGQAVASDGGVDALVALRTSGRIQNVSLGMNDPSYVTRMLREKPPGTFDSIMSAGAWNVIDQDGYDLLLECQRRGVKVHNAGIFASGLLVGGSHYKYAPAPKEILDRREKWQKLCEKHRVALPAAAMAFALGVDVVEKAAVGVKSADEVKASAEWLDHAKHVPNALWDEAKETGLLEKHIPTPFMS